MSEKHSKFNRYMFCFALVLCLYGAAAKAALNSQIFTAKDYLLSVPRCLLRHPIGKEAMLASKRTDSLSLFEPIIHPSDVVPTEWRFDYRRQHDQGFGKYSAPCNQSVSPSPVEIFDYYRPNWKFFEGGRRRSYRNPLPVTRRMMTAVDDLPKKSMKLSIQLIETLKRNRRSRSLNSSPNSGNQNTPGATVVALSSRRGYRVPRLT